jgi:hypothetical protein
MGLLIQWILFVCGEDDPLGSEPIICGEDGPLETAPASGG